MLAQINLTALANREALLPGYFTLVGLSGLVVASVTLRLARRDNADLRHESRSLMSAYVGALLGGYMLEGLRLLPAAIRQHSVAPLLHGGRAAYGGLIFATLAACAYRYRVRQPLAPFLDRMSLGGGLSFCLVRIGCFKAGCDYGLPTASHFGIRYPSGSPAALEHFRHGWIACGMPSLPVHPTQLYESVLGLLSAVVAGMLLRRSVRDGSTFRAWMLLYAAGRFFIEFFRGDASRGVYGSLSSAQIISVAIWCFYMANTAARRRGSIQNAAVSP